jgi:sulfate adenylyltransferase
MARAYERETGVIALPFEELLWVAEERRYVERSKLHGRSGVAISGTEVRERFLPNGEPLPEWFTRPEIARLLSSASLPARRPLRVCVTGLEAASQADVSTQLAARLEEVGREAVIVDADGDVCVVASGIGAEAVADIVVSRLAARGLLPA